MIVYIDKDYKCHISDDGTMTAVETSFFNNRCNAFIEGYRFVPEGEQWIREDGEIFEGEMIAPAEEYSLLENVQLTYELQVMNEYKESLEILGVEV